MLEFVLDPTVVLCCNIGEVPALSLDLIGSGVHSEGVCQSAGALTRRRRSAPTLP